jgi:hypothetical protein
MKQSNQEPENKREIDWSTHTLADSITETILELVLAKDYEIGRLRSALSYLASAADNAIPHLHLPHLQDRLRKAVKIARELLDNR